MSRARKRLWGVVGFAGGLLAASGVQAESPRALKGLACQADGTIAHDDVIAALIKGAGMSVTGDVLTAFASNVLGTKAEEWSVVPEREISFPAADLLAETRELLESRGSGAVVVGTGAPADLDLLLLNRSAGSLVRFPCEPVRRESTASSWRDALIVTSVDDAGKTGKFADRPFAAFSYLDNRDNDEQVGSADVYIGFSRRIWLDGAVGPSLSYQRRTGKDPQNDLTFALEGGDERLRWSAGYETDDGFESALYRAKVEFKPFNDANPCARAFVSGGSTPDRGGRCDLWILADYVNVSDIGGKTALATRREFGRVGARAAARWWTRAGAGSDAFW